MKKQTGFLLALLAAGACLSYLPQAHAGLFEDEEARRHILDLRAKVSEFEQNKADNSSLLEVSNQNEALRAEVDRLRGQVEVLTNQVTTLENQQKDFYLDLDERLKKLEPKQPQDKNKNAKNAKDSKEAKDSKDAKDTASAASDGSEEETFSRAEELFGAGSYKKAIAAYSDFLKRYPKSNLIAKAQYQMGNAYYLQGDYKNALKNQTAVVKRFPKNQITPDAMLNMASCQIGLGNVSAAKQTLNDLVAKYPKSNAAKRAKKMLAQLG